MLKALHWAARHGKEWLVAGLLAGLFLPQLAAALRPWLPEMVAFLLFLTAYRIGPKAAFGAAAEARRAFIFALAFQLVMPLAALAILLAIGTADAAFGLVLVLMLAAPSVTGSPNFAIMLGHDPTPALRLLIVGTLMFPLTVLPILWLSPALGNQAEVAMAAFRLIAVIAGAVTAAFALRTLGPPVLTNDRRDALDGLSAITLAVIVIGLMAALGPALKDDPLNALAWVVFAFALNFGLQIASYFTLNAIGDYNRAAPVSIVAGNRNIALFLVALPASVTDPLLIFIGCYQLPMYLTPILLRFLYLKPSRKRS